MCIEKVRYQSIIVCHISTEFKDNFNWNLKTELMNIIIQLSNIMFCGGRNSKASQIGRVTMCPGFFRYRYYRTLDCRAYHMLDPPACGTASVIYPLVLNSGVHSITFTNSLTLCLVH